MAFDEVGQIDELVDGLKVNDKKAVSDYEDFPRKPKAAMNDLVKIGKPAVEHLLELLKDGSRFSCFYALEVLCKIEDPRTVQPLLGLFSNDVFMENFIDMEPEYLDMYVEAFRKIGLPSLEPILTFLEDSVKQGEGGVYGIMVASRILAGIKDEKSFTALVNILSLKMDNEGYPQIRAIEALAEYGDKRAVEPVRKFLENDIVRDYALDALRKMVSLKEYRVLAAPYVLKRLDKFASAIGKNLEALKWAHRLEKRFAGDDADELNFISLEHEIFTAVFSLVKEVFELAKYEANYPELDFNKIFKKRQEWMDYEFEHQEEVGIINRCCPDFKSTLTKSYKGLVSPAYGSHTKIDALLLRISQWLKEQGFSVTSDNTYNLLARRGKRRSRQGCIASVGSDYDSGKTWGIVRLSIWGNGWTKGGMEEFDTSFWAFSETVIRKLVGKKKFECQIVKGQ
jgi:HEAT repeat protein